jgi:hypothetical protein
METFLKILNWITANWDVLLGAGVATVSFVSGVVAAVKNRNWNKLKEALVEYVKEAEALQAGGEVKKEVVLAKAQTLCVALKIKYNEQKVSAIVESIVLLSKIVNARDKDKIVK